MGIGLAQAHEHWVDADTFYPDTAEGIALHLCSGHYFPKSSMLLKDGVLHGTFLRGPGSDTRSLMTTAREKRRTCHVVPDRAGSWIAGFILKRPQGETPAYEAKAVLVVGNGDDDAESYADGQGLELVPQRPISKLALGDKLPVRLQLDGIPVAAMIQVTAEDGKSAVLRTRPGRPALVAISNPGRYLVTASLRGRGCSLVFCVKREGAS